MKLIILLLLAALAGCAATPDANYDAYLSEVRASRQEKVMERKGIADAAASCAGDATCVVAVAGFAALAAQSGGQGQQIAPYQRQAGAAERIALATIGALPGLGQVFAAIDSGRNAVDIARIGAQRDIGIAGQWSGAITGTAGAFAGVTSDVANAFAGLPPTTQVGGDLISGTQHIGDSIGRDAIGGDQHVGDAIGGDAVGGDQRHGDDIGRDVIGGDRIADSNIGDDNRIGSDGPFTDDNSGQCQGERCQGDGDTFPPPEPEPDPVDPGAPIVGPPGG